MIDRQLIFECICAVIKALPFILLLYFEIFALLLIGG